MTEPEKPHELTAEEKAQQESFKLVFEVYKHITTLSSGTIIILATFLEKVLKAPKIAYSNSLSIGCLLFLILSIIFSLSVMAQIAGAQQLFNPIGKREKAVISILCWLSPLTFILGITCLAMLTLLSLSSQENQ